MPVKTGPTTSGTSFNNTILADVPKAETSRADWGSAAATLLSRLNTPRHARRQ
eukprot:CAMPEP_0204169952 /NCGR_PEP_ID=MMETSP0361-20130328/41978_1 /ASSEMBLY_ACC=CAM_ASM_000343 /TAXON_ID=268821 /ORGANISM="Scrippsiella Hangoei, Strain SHTV-5" /LENGTH=52 /DNA_ID=CAMNT_0051127613 /DNA_START=316 /DNA_END=471 /DNA_ORIENTATION=+